MTVPQPGQCAPAVLMVRPAAFGYNAETAETNTFQEVPTDEAVAVCRGALAEFDAAVAALRGAGVEVVVVDDRPEPVTPDAVFPNNWITTHHDGTVILYPMQPDSRRLEVRADIPELLSGESGFDVRRVIDLTRNADHGRYLEGTGSIVFDHPHRVAYACLSPRTSRAMLYEVSEVLGYDCVVFRASDASRRDIYHTNVVMSVGRRWAVICAEAITATDERDMVVGRLAETGRDVIALTRVQMSAFCANILELQRADGQGVVAASARAWGALTRPQREVLENGVTVVSVPLPTIEAVGGGSFRCMLAEIFLPRLAPSRRDSALSRPNRRLVR